MKKLKKYKFLFIVLSLFCIAGCSFRAEPEHETIPVPEQTTYLVTEPKTQKATFPPTETTPLTEPVSQPEQELPEILYHALSQYQESVCLDIPVDPDVLTEVMNQLERDHPEIFWINGYSMHYDNQSAEIIFKIIDQYTPDQLRKMADELELTVQEILRNIDQNATDYEKILQIHDYLVAITEYDSASAFSSQKNISNSAYGCLVNHKAVCQGYAQAFQLLLNRLGIECGICSGVARNEPHAWNYVLLGQKYYWVDVTWDDPVRDTEESTFPDDWVHHNYFLLDDAMLNRSRSFDDKNLFIPVCDSLEENYFVKNQNYLDSYDFAEINRRLTENSAVGRLEVMFRTEEAYQACLQDLFYENHIWNMDIFQNTGGQIRYQQDPDLYILRFLFTTN